MMEATHPPKRPCVHPPNQPTARPPRRGFCGTGYSWCSADKGYCMGGPCKDYSDRPIAQVGQLPGCGAGGRGGAVGVSCSDEHGQSAGAATLCPKARGCMRVSHLSACQRFVPPPHARRRPSTTAPAGAPMWRPMSSGRCSRGRPWARRCGPTAGRPPAPRSPPCDRATPARRRPNKFHDLHVLHPFFSRNASAPSAAHRQGGRWGRLVRHHHTRSCWFGQAGTWSTGTAGSFGYNSFPAAPAFDFN